MINITELTTFLEERAPLTVLPGVRDFLAAWRPHPEKLDPAATNEIILRHLMFYAPRVGQRKNPLVRRNSYVVLFSKHATLENILRAGVDAHLRDKEMISLLLQVLDKAKPPLTVPTGLCVRPYLVSLFEGTVETFQAHPKHFNLSRRIKEFYGLLTDRYLERPDMCIFHPSMHVPARQEPPAAPVLQEPQQQKRLKLGVHLACGKIREASFFLPRDVQYLFLQYRQATARYGRMWPINEPPGKQLVQLRHKYQETPGKTRFGLDSDSDIEDGEVSLRRIPILKKAIRFYTALERFAGMVEMMYKYVKASKMTELAKQYLVLLNQLERALDKLTSLYGDLPYTQDAERTLKELLCEIAELIDSIDDRDALLTGTNEATRNLTNFEKLPWPRRHSIREDALSQPILWIELPVDDDDDEEEDESRLDLDPRVNVDKGKVYRQQSDDDDDDDYDDDDDEASDLDGFIVSDSEEIE
jgi:hypothetical protein